MSDDKKTEKPLEKPHVNVEVVPKEENNPRHQDAAKTLRKKLKENIQKVVEKNQPAGKEKQFEAAGAETKKAGRDTNPKEIKEIRVNVSGTDQDGDTERRAWTVTPKENPPPPKPNP